MYTSDRRPPASCYCVSVETCATGFLSQCWLAETLVNNLCLHCTLYRITKRGLLLRLSSTANCHQSTFGFPKDYVLHVLKRRAVSETQTSKSLFSVTFWNFDVGKGEMRRKGKPPTPYTFAHPPENTEQKCERSSNPGCENSWFFVQSYLTRWSVPDEGLDQM